jgi:integrase/recombinase XerD
MILNDAIALFLASRKRRGCNAGTVESYAKKLRWLKQYLSTLGIADISGVTQQVLEGYSDHERTRTKQQQDRLLSVVTIHKGLMDLRTFFTWAKEAGIVAESPAAKLAIPRVGRRLPKALKPHQVMRLLQMPMAPREKAIIFLMIDSGLRLAETSNLDIDDLDLNRGTALVRQGKGDKDRLVMFNERTSEVLRQWLAARRADKDNPAFFVDYMHRRFSTRAMYRAIKRVACAAGIEAVMRPHVLRHTFATLYLNNGGSIQDLSALMGHTHISTTMIYWSVSSEVLHRKHVRFSPIGRMFDAPMPEEFVR